MLKRLLICLIFLPAQLAAQDTQTDTFLQHLRLDEMIIVMRQEGLVDNATMPEDLLGEATGASWQDTLDEIYDLERMEDTVVAAMLQSLGGGDISEIEDFAASPIWQEAVDLELEARVAMLDTDVADAAVEAYYRHFDKNSRRLRDLQELAETADLIEGNVVGALNSILQFNLGMMHGGFDVGYTEDELLAQIWSEEDAVRNDIAEWLYSFLLLAYDPMDRETLNDQIAFFETEQGQRLNQALFDGFNAMFDAISFDLGEAIANLMHEQVL